MKLEHFSLLDVVISLCLFTAAGCNSKQPAADSPKTAKIEAPIALSGQLVGASVEGGRPSWEVMPQEAGAGEVILSKRNELGLLSNFAATPFEYRGKRYASLEGFWQMMKYPEGPDDARAKFPGLEWKYTRDEVSQLTSFDAKKAGDLASANMKKMGIDWVTFDGKHIPYRPAEPGEHYRLIVEATREKVRQNPEVQRVLLATGELILKPDHHQPADAMAAWRYYEILTQIRAELRHKGGELEKTKP